MVTLVGVGGVGKTRLAVQSAAMLSPQFRDGVWLMELASVTDGNGVDAAVASVFMLQPQPDLTWRQVVVQGLQGREVLLVVDNCEHVLDETAALVDALAACHSVRVLATSREALGVRAEWAWRVPSLAGAAAVGLFVERASTAAAGFCPDDGDLRVIAEICDRLDGIPLAIELAAARVRSMSPTQIRDRLDERFRLLTGSRRSVERHQTLRQAVQWSYDLLEPIEQTVLQHLSVFVGGFALDAATELSGLDEYEVLDVLDSLVRRSLLHVDRTGNELRYSMLETIRQFAEEALAATGPSDAVRDRHAAYFADESDRAAARHVTDDEPLALRWVDAEIANLTAAFHWAISRHLTDPAVRIAMNTHAIARVLFRTTTFDWPEQALALAREVQHRQLPHLLAAACDAATGVGRFADAAAHGLEAIALNQDNRYEFWPFAYYVTSMALVGTGDIDGSLRLVREGAEHPADDPVRANLLFLHVLHHIFGRSLPEQESLEAIALLKRSSMPTIRAGGFWVHANLLSRSDAAAAIELYQQALDLNPGSRTLEVMCRSMQVALIAETSNVETAVTGFTHVVDAWQAARGDNYAHHGISMLGSWLTRLGYHDGAARLLGVLTRGQPEIWSALPPEFTALPDLMDQAEFAAAYEAGSTLDTDTAATLAHRLLAEVRADHLNGSPGR